MDYTEKPKDVLLMLMFFYSTELWAVSLRVVLFKMLCVSTTSSATSAVVYVSYRQSSSRHVLVVATPPLSRGSSAGRLLLLRSSKNKIKCLKGHSGGTATARHIQLPHIVIDLTLWGDHYQQKVIFETAFNPRASSGPKCPPTTTNSTSPFILRSICGKPRYSFLGRVLWKADNTARRETGAGLFRVDSEWRRVFIARLPLQG